MKYLMPKHYRGGPTPEVDIRRWISGSPARSTHT